MSRQNLSNNETLLDRLYSIAPKEYPRIWGIFNNWNVPDEFKDLMPDYVGFENMEESHETIKPVQDEIKRICGMKQLLKYHNSNRMTPDEFEEFWKYQICS